MEIVPYHIPCVPQVRIITSIEDGIFVDIPALAESINNRIYCYHEPLIEYNANIQQFPIKTNNLTYHRQGYSQSNYINKSTTGQSSGDSGDSARVSTPLAIISISASSI